jgi:hypothetical protein
MKNRHLHHGAELDLWTESPSVRASKDGREEGMHADISPIF